MEYSRLPFLFCLSAVWMLANAGAPAPAGGRPGCQTRCGDVDIPFPFGIGKRCAFRRGFQLKCTTVNNTRKPFTGNIEVTKISVPDGKAWMRTHIAMQWYDPSTNSMMYRDASLNITNSPFRLSDVDNKIIIVGCNTLAYLGSHSEQLKITSHTQKPQTAATKEQPQRLQYIIGCLSTCNNDTTPMNGSCSGAGCCQVDVPIGIQYYSAYFNSDYNTTEIWRSSPCGYMALMETAAFNFSTTYLTSTVFNDTYGGRAPVVMDWVITLDTCEEAKRNTTSYTCVSSNSQCVDSSDGRGYRCSCSNGYEGNPYINDGCKDIDECLDNATYPCPGICENTLGSFACSCHPGYYMLNGVCMPNRTSRATPGLLVGTGVGSGMSLLAMVFGILLVKQKLKVLRAKKLRAKFFEQNRGLLLQQLVDKDIAERMIFSLEELEKATNKFDETRKLGGGGHGTVYKGVLSSQHVVAIKRSKNTIQREIDDFINEVAILSQINHRNVVRLFGCCLETEVPLLVYEFISNGTLSNHLHVEDPQSLSWEDRLRIALETASALAYLHSSASTSVIHRDIKSDNILLDDRLTAKVSDFGASRGIPIDQTGVTTAIQGTFGYLDPEYYQTSRLTDKSDVYSFGVILVELLTRKRPSYFMSSERVSLIAQFNLLMSQDKLCEILDPQVFLEGAEDAEVVAALAATCLSLNGEARPTMRQVEMRLQRLLGAVNNTIQRRKVELNYDTSTQMSQDKDSSSSRHYSIEQEALLSASFPR